MYSVGLYCTHMYTYFLSFEIKYFLTFISIFSICLSPRL